MTVGIHRFIDHFDKVLYFRITPAREILEELDKNPDVTVLILEGNTFGIPASKTVGKQLEKHPKLKVYYDFPSQTFRILEIYERCFKYEIFNSTEITSC